MSGVHAALGWLAVGAAVIVAIVAVVSSLTLGRRWGRALARLTDILVIFVAVLVFVALFLGGLLLVTGLRPTSTGHILVAVAALLTLPIAAGIGLWAEGGAGRGPTRYRWLAGGSAVLAVLGIMLAMSG